MKKNWVIICLLLNGMVNGQNLVPNPSFEIYDTCPTHWTLTKFAIPWFQPTYATSDYFNACDTFGAIPMVGVPLNWFGSQDARTGVGYCGIWAYLSTINYSEYIEVKLSDSLRANKRYTIKFYVSLADNSHWAIDGIGAYFSKDSIINSGFSNSLPFIPQVSNPKGNIITDKISWTLISGNYISQGGEQFITIGNFFNYPNVDTLYLPDGGDVNNFGLMSYYYIDDVSVILDEDSSLFIPNIFSPNGDGKNDEFIIIDSAEIISHVFIYNRWGQLVFQTDDNVNFHWNGKLNTKDLEEPDGVYYYVLFLKNQSTTKTGCIQLIR